jgi:hypothetical protein
LFAAIFLPAPDDFTYGPFSKVGLRNPASGILALAFSHSTFELPVIRCRKLLKKQRYAMLEPEKPSSIARWHGL